MLTATSEGLFILDSMTNKAFGYLSTGWIPNIAIATDCSNENLVSGIT